METGRFFQVCRRAMPRRLPCLLVALRVLLGPAIYIAAIRGIAGGWIIAGLTAALLSDVFDGILARRSGVATARLRVADGLADGVFYCWIGLAVCRTVPEAVCALRGPLLILLSIQLLSYMLDGLRYGRIASFHAYTAKAWGLTLFVAAFALLGLHQGGLFLWPAIVCGVLCNLEGLAIRSLLPEWRHDVPSVFHALRLRRPQQGR